MSPGPNTFSIARPRAQQYVEHVCTQLLYTFSSPYLLSRAWPCYDGMVAQGHLNWEPGRQLLYLS